MIFDANTPPPMPLSALLYLPTWMKLVHRHAPWMVYWMMRNARRDALAVQLWLRFYVFQYAASVRWLKTHAEPVMVASL